ncbi:MAG: hypothetical protein N2248_00445 [candidate division WOR-3 bacterium]|nr:hypothetical protein [candidate division WOR-3 bacterium]
MANAVGSDILFQLVGESGPVDLGVFESLDIKPNPEVNERRLNDGTVESEQISPGFWTISIKRPKRSLTLERLLDLFASQNTVPNLQAVYTVRDPNTGEIGQWLFTGIRLRGFGNTVDGGKIDETVEFSANKRTPIT